LYDSFNFHNLLLNDNLWNNSFHNLRNFNHFLDHSGNDNDFLNDFLNFHDLGNFNHLLNNLFHRHFDFLNSVNVLDHLDDFLFNILDGLRNVNVVVHNSLHFDGLGFFDDDWVSQVDFLNDGVLESLDNWLLNDLLDCDESLVDDGNFNNLFNFPDYFSDDFDWDLDFLDDLLDSVLDNNFLNNPLHLFDLLNDSLNSDYFLDDLWNFNYSLNCLNDWDWSFDDSIYNIISNFDMVFYLFSVSVLNLRHYLFNNLLHFDDFGDLYHSINNLLHDHRDLSDYFNHSLSWNHFLHENLHLLNLSFDVVDNSFHLNNSFYLDWSLLDSVNDLDFWNFLHDFHNSLNNLRNLHNFLHNPFNWNHFLNDVWDNGWDLQWNVDNLFDFSNFLHFHNLFNNFLNDHNLRNLHDSVDDLFDYFLYFDNFGNNSEHLENVINVNNTHNFLVDHTDDPFIDFQHCACSSSQLFKLFQEGLDQHSQVELNSSGFLAAISIHVFNFDDLRYVLHDFNKPVDLINLNDIDELLLEELRQSHIHLIKELRIFLAETLHLNSKQVNQMLSPCVLHWNFDCSLAESFQVDYVSCCFVH
jgi:hypothetical protein